MKDFFGEVIGRDLSKETKGVELPESYGYPDVAPSGAWPITEPPHCRAAKAASTYDIVFK